MSTPPPQPPRRSAGDGKKVTPPSTTIVTRNGARKAKIQTRAMSAGAKPSAAVIAAKKKAQQKKKMPINVELKDPYQVAMESKNRVKGPTGFVTEPRMAEHRCLWDENYPECPERLVKVIERCNELNLIEQCKQYPPRAATKEELSVLHSPSVYEMMETTHNNHDVEYLEKLSSKYDAVYIHPSTHELALLAAGSTIELVSRIVSGEVQNGAAFVRPPGHHALRAEPCGYCFYNNVALAARHAIDRHGLSRILIVDWDVHHGQATQQMFYNDPRVLYFSIHRYEHGSFWPSLRQSDFPFAGGRAAAGTTCNVPLNAVGMTDADYMAIWHQLLLPMAMEYQPELIIISAGYDAAIGCPEGEMQLTSSCYARLTWLLSAVCPRVCVVLEGGYCVPSLADGAAATLRALLGHPPPDYIGSEGHCDSIRETILNCIYVQKKYWNCFKYQPVYSEGAPNVCEGERQRHTVCVRWEGDETRPDSFATRDCYPVQDDEFKRKIKERLDNLRSVIDLSIPVQAVGYVYDLAMLKHKNICEPGHPECPERILRIHERHREFGLLARLTLLPARPADAKRILAVHGEDYYNKLKTLSSTKLRDLNAAKESYDSVYFHPDSLESAAMAAGCVIQAVESVLSGSVQSGVCVVRPPGHHAGRCAAAGFCLLNNVCVGAAAATAAGNRVLVLDWDVHHGNGTQELTYEDDQILYISLHRYDHGSFFPHSKQGDYTAVGSGKGEGYNVNIPWNKRGMGDAEYLAAFTQLVLPIAYEFRPDLVIVSAGFDAGVGDPLGGCKVTPECFGQMTQLLRSLAGGRVILCLEGGYNVTSIAYCMAMCTRALLGDPLPAPTARGAAPHPAAVHTINDVISVHKKYWKCLDFQRALPEHDVLGELPASRGLPAGNELELEASMGRLKVCDDGVHCGTDDEDAEPHEDGKPVSAAGSSTDANVPPKPGSTAGSNIPPEAQPGCSKCAREGDDRGTTQKRDTVNEGAGSSTSRVEAEPTTLVDFLAQNMQAIADGEMFAVVPLTWCPHVEEFSKAPPTDTLVPALECVDCGDTTENWVCLHCHVTACARGVRGHMQAHWARTAHALVVSVSDLSAWCCACAAYLDHRALYRPRNDLHRWKFGDDLPWTYGDQGRAHTLHLDTQ